MPRARDLTVSFGPFLAREWLAPRPRGEWPAGADRARTRRAAGLLLLFSDDNQPHLVLTVRTDSLGRHGGQVSLPGGVIEPQPGRRRHRRHARNTRRSFWPVPFRVGIHTRRRTLVTVPVLELNTARRGVHGMCGYWAARGLVLERVFSKRVPGRDWRSERPRRSSHRTADPFGGGGSSGSAAEGWERTRDPGGCEGNGIHKRRTEPTEDERKTRSSTRQVGGVTPRRGRRSEWRGRADARGPRHPPALVSVTAPPSILERAHAPGLLGASSRFGSILSSARCELASLRPSITGRAAKLTVCQFRSVA